MFYNWFICLILCSIVFSNYVFLTSSYFFISSSLCTSSLIFWYFYAFELLLKPLCFLYVNFYVNKFDLALIAICLLLFCYTCLLLLVDATP